MALIQCDFFSDVLGLSMTMNVILPQYTSAQIGMEGLTRSAEKFPCLWLLHGLSDDHSTWMRRSSIERYVADKGIAVVMPAVHRSFYTNIPDGGQYWEYISEELPQIARSFFPLSDARKDNFVAGLSMGGYGALKLALNYPDRYAAAASLSGAVHRDWFIHGKRKDELALIFGNESDLIGSKNDLCHVATALNAADGEKPQIFQCCGTEDFLYESNCQFRDVMQKLDYDFTYEDGPGAHEWGYWDTNIRRVLEWLPL